MTKDDTQSWRLEARVNHTELAWELQPSWRDLGQEVTYYLNKALNIGGTSTYATLIQAVEIPMAQFY